MKNVDSKIQEMAEFRKIIKEDSKVQKEYQEPLKKNEKTFSRQPKREQKALIQSKVLEKAINIMEETIEGMDIEKE